MKCSLVKWFSPILPAGTDSDCQAGMKGSGPLTSLTNSGISIALFALHGGHTIFHAGYFLCSLGFKGLGFRICEFSTPAVGHFMSCIPNSQMPYESCRLADLKVG